MNPLSQSSHTEGTLTLGKAQTERKDLAPVTPNHNLLFPLQWLRLPREDPGMGLGSIIIWRRVLKPH
jgi:hypothetical protein